MPVAKDLDAREISSWDLDNFSFISAEPVFSFVVAWLKDSEPLASWSIDANRFEEFSAPFFKLFA